jgi:hypothetical protein
LARNGAALFVNRDTLLSEKQGCGPVKTGKNWRDIREKSGFPALCFQLLAASSLGGATKRSGTAAFLGTPLPLPLVTAQLGHRRAAELNHL